MVNCRFSAIGLEPIQTFNSTRHSQCHLSFSLRSELLLLDISSSPEPNSLNPYLKNFNLTSLLLLQTHLSTLYSPTLSFSLPPSSGISLSPFLPYCWYSRWKFHVMSRRYYLTAGILFLWLLQFSLPLFHNVPWASCIRYKGSLQLYQWGLVIPWLRGFKMDRTVHAAG